ncbi:MAG: glycogen/starch synthase [Nitrospiraceae bacterium]|nr:MAG: glycogen/starch synthase [Nitrospiraceae bacterium]
MGLNFKGWKKNWSLMSAFFNAEEIRTITDRLKHLTAEHIVFCSFENRFARSGGLATVITNILPYLKELNTVQSVILLTPFYPHIMDGKKLRPTGIKFNVQFSGKPVRAELYEYTWSYTSPLKGSIKEYYIGARGFFEASNSLKDPYIYIEKSKEQNNKALCRNALFYCKAVPSALGALGIRKNIIFHLHEWQTAFVSLTSKEAMLNRVLISGATVQTMHNSYDSQISWKELKSILTRPRRPSLARISEQSLSAYQIGLQLVDAPLTTVSENFAKELTTDIIQTKHYAPHLQNILKANKTFGINNGMFVDFSPEFPKKDKHTLSEIKNVKLKNRKALLEILDCYHPKERFGELTYREKSIIKLPDNVPIVVMTGRLDPIQKGYFVLLRSIEKFARDKIKFILAPLPVNPAHLDYFYEIACKCRGNVTVFPLRMIKGYRELQTGSTFGVMPSIYEPFGAAVEYMASGTVVIGRATGGLVDQIDNTCGFLFKEDAVFYKPENIRDFIDSGTIMQANKINTWAQSMADNLSLTLKKASEIYQNHPSQYYRLIQESFKKASRFDWRKAAKKYFQVYNMVNNK